MDQTSLLKSRDKDSRREEPKLRADPSGQGFIAAELSRQGTDNRLIEYLDLTICNGIVQPLSNHLPLCKFLLEGLIIDAVTLVRITLDTLPCDPGLVADL